MAAFTSRFSVSSLTLEKTFSRYGMWAVDLWRLSWKFWSSRSFSAATSLLVLSSTFSSFCHTWELDAASWLCSLATGLPVLFQSCWQVALSFSGLFDAIGPCTVEELVAACETKFNVGFDFATILSSPFSSCILFAIVSGKPAELKVWMQQIELKWLMLNKWRRLFHSSRVKFPLSMCLRVGAWVSTSLIRIFGSRLVLSNNQSRATLWVLDTCLVVRLLPLMITASLSSKTYRTELRRLRVRRNIINIAQFRNVVLDWSRGLVLGVFAWLRDATGFPVLFLWTSSIG